ncbi:MAG: hypothetical protein H5T63_04100 [Chloroflexi bacterium]|nr:hypothetical protein [Chloroflexota bacterium]
MIVNFLVKLPLFMAYLLGAALTGVLMAKRRNLSSALAFLGFMLLVAVQAVWNFTMPFTMRLSGRGVPVTRAALLSAFATFVLNLIAAVAVLCIVGAIAMATRNQRQL